MDRLRLKTTIKNLSPHAREHWVVVTFPSSMVEGFGEECTFVVNEGVKWRAVRGKTTGSKTVYRIRANVDGEEEVKGFLTNLKSPDAGSFAPHPWVIDDPLDLVPELFGETVEILSPPSLIEQSPAHMRWHTKVKAPRKGLIMEFWGDMLHDDPVMPYKGKIVWSDRNDPTPSRIFDSAELKLAIGEYFVLDFQEKKGMWEPILVGNKWVSVINDKLIAFRDGAGVPLSFNLLAWTNHDVPPDSDPDDLDPYEVKSIRNLEAAAHGNMWGVCHHWDTHWCAAKNLPKKGPGYHSTREEDISRFEDSLKLNTGLFDPIPYGIGKTPGQTGDQEDFGATKGTYVVVDKDMRFMPALQYVTYCELFRGMNHYGEDGEPLVLEHHPNWVTWSGKTHWHTGVSPDRLGKESTSPPTGSWQGYDDQHRSQNNFAAYGLLTDDPLVDDQMKHQYTTDAACYRIRFPKNSAGAARAQGRQSGTWAQFLTITDGKDRENWKGLLDIRLKQMADQDGINVGGPMKVLATNGRDGRKQIYDNNGELARTVSLWEHGLALVGLYGVWKQHRTPDVEKVMTLISEMFLEYAWIVENGKNYVVGDIIWNDGEDPPGGMVLSNGWDERGSNPMTQKFLYTEGARSVNIWTFTGILVAREFLGRQDVELDNFIEAIVDEGPNNRRQAEWWAAVNNV